MSKRILIIEDDPVGLELMEYALQDQGYETQTTPNGLKGVSLARDHELDLVVLDVMLPGLDGFEVCRHLKTQPETSHLPILMLSAKAQQADVETGRRAGADMYLTKPIDPSALVGKVRSLLGEEPQNA